MIGDQFKTAVSCLKKSEFMHLQSQVFSLDNQSNKKLFDLVKNSVLIGFPISKLSNKREISVQVKEETSTYCNKVALFSHLAMDLRCNELLKLIHEKTNNNDRPAELE